MWRPSQLQKEDTEMEEKDNDSDGELERDEEKEEPRMQPAQTSQRMQSAQTSTASRQQLREQQARAGLITHEELDRTSETVRQLPGGLSPRVAQAALNAHQRKQRQRAEQREEHRRTIQKRARQLVCGALTLQ
jgi:hypothetical protein